MKKIHNKKNRIYSLDVTRGFIVVLSVFLSAIPSGGYEYFRHAEWYGFTILDLILPSFITIFGISMAIAYQRGIIWGKFLKRTIRLLVYGILFTMIVSWSIDLPSLRLTGVLQMFALLGLATVLITRFCKSPIKLIILSMILLFVYGLVLSITSQSCADGLPQPTCNLSGMIDVKVFGENHIYAQGERGFDPEGLVNGFAALSNVLIGFAIGSFILLKKETGGWKENLTLGVILILLSIIVYQFLPYNKRIWTPSFALLTTGITACLLSIFYLIIDYKKSVDVKKTILGPIVTFFEAFGRNSFFIYFGKFIISSVLVHITMEFEQQQRPISFILLKWFESFSPFPQLSYAAMMLLFWTIIALYFHRKKIYIKV